MLIGDKHAAVTPGGTRSQAEIDQIHQSLRARYDELHSEYEQAVAETKILSLESRADSAGDDEADSGSKTSERECEMSVIRSLLDRRRQVEHALARLADGAYGWCEGCRAPIPVERLTVFPWATSCVACKQVRERRAS